MGVKLAKAELRCTKQSQWFAFLLRRPSKTHEFTHHGFAMSPAHGSDKSDWLAHHEVQAGGALLLLYEGHGHVDNSAAAFRRVELCSLRARFHTCHH